MKNLSEFLFPLNLKNSTLGSCKPKGHLNFLLSKRSKVLGMKKQTVILQFLLLFGSLELQADSSSLTDTPQRLVIQNRILAKVGNKTLSVLDVTKKMEVLFNRYYPQYANSPMAKYQYFSSQWRETLLQMIDHELILADAEKLDLKITDSEVRETLHEKFGPNLMSSLDSLGLSYEEAKSMIYSELAVQKMTWFKVHAKAFNSVNAQDIKQAYVSYCDKNPPKDTWEYQVLSIKAKDEDMARKAAERACELCKDSPQNIASIVDKVRESLPLLGAAESQVSITLSEDVKLDSKSLSEAHKNALISLTKNSISAPIKQISRADQSSVFRIFYLKDHVKTILPSLRAMYETLQNQLVQEAAEKESKTYIAKLRQRYGFDSKMLEETIPQGFQPFSLQ